MRSPARHARPFEAGGAAAIIVPACGNAIGRLQLSSCAYGEIGPYLLSRLDMSPLIMPCLSIIVNIEAIWHIDDRRIDAAASASGIGRLPGDGNAVSAECCLTRLIICEATGKPEDLHNERAHERRAQK